MREPIGAGYCEHCDTRFFVYNPQEVQIWMDSKPKPPQVMLTCPKCTKTLVCTSTHHHVWKFKQLGVQVFHVYDEETDIQPLTDEDIEEFSENIDSILELLLHIEDDEESDDNQG